jgi:HEAT repeat protein
MHENSLRIIEKLLTGGSMEDLRKGLQLADEGISRPDSTESGEMLEILTTLFYLDTIERPELAPILNEAIRLVAKLGKRNIPVLLEKFDGQDFKAQLAIANALGRIGADAINPLIQEFHRITDCDRRAFIIYAFGKIKSPQVAAAVPLVLEAAGMPHTELQDTAIRAIGKMAESILPGALSEETRQRMVGLLKKNLASGKAGIRSKALRSLGKLAKSGHLTPDEKRELKDVCEGIAGGSDRFEWDRAYIVRREAREALQYC